MRSLMVAGVMLLVGLSGCFGFDPAGEIDYVPGQDWKPTGKEVNLQATVVDWVMHEVFPGFHANLWAFCMKPKDPNDQYSSDAIEYWSSVPTDGYNSQEFGAWEGMCSVPAPTLRVQQGDLVTVEFSHTHFHRHTIHWHGQHLPWKVDGVPGVTQDSVAKEDSEPFVYQFHAARAGTLWYHCHVDTHFHVMQGLFGLFIVEPQDDRWEPKDIDREYNLVFHTLRRDLVQVTEERIVNPHKDHGHAPGECGASGVAGCQNPPADLTPDTWLLNGRSMPNSMMDEDTIIKVTEGERIRIRILNSGETTETFHTHGHDMLVTHIDGNPLHPSARYYVDTLPVHPASRYDVVIDANLPGLWVAHTHVDGHVTNSHQAPGGSGTMIIYEEILEQEGAMRPFADGAELFGGQPWVEPLVIPSDVRAMATRQLEGFDVNNPGGAGSDSVQVGFQVTMPCAVRKVYVNVEQNAQFAHPQGDDLTLTIFDGDDRQIFEDADFDGSADLVLDPVTNNAVTWLAGDGTFRAVLAGQVGQGTASFDITVDYFEDELGIQGTGRVTKGTECDPADRIFDPIKFIEENPDKAP